MGGGERRREKKDANVRPRPFVGTNDNNVRAESLRGATDGGSKKNKPPTKNGGSFARRQTLKMPSGKRR